MQPLLRQQQVEGHVGLLRGAHRNHLILGAIGAGRAAGAGRGTSAAGRAVTMQPTA
jgi:hypothetical protein